MKKDLVKIEELIKEAISKKGFIICDINYITENKYNFLKITLDKENGIDLDDIVKATNIINPLLDEYDLIDEEYILDISSKERG